LIVTLAGSVLFSLPLASSASPFLSLAAIRNKDSALPSLASSPFFLPVAFFLLVFSLFIALPLLALMLDSIIALQNLLKGHTAFWELIGEPLSASIFISSSSALLTIILALMAAIGLFHLGKISDNGALACERSFFLVLGISPVVLSLAYFVFFQPILSFSGITLWIIIAIQSISSLAFAIKSLVQSVMITKKNCELFAQVVGLPGWKQFFVTELPGMLPALGSAFLVSFALSLSNLSVIAMFSQSRIETIPLLIYRLMAVYRYPEAAVLSIGLALFCLGALWAKWRLERRMFSSSHLG
jgi:ABC-type Fe3+ transport system permease subunit